jgi:predicted PurR-regulated permease PerM
MLYGLLNVVLLSILGVPYAVFLGVLAGVFYLIPYIGNFISVAAIALAVASSDKTGFLGMQFADNGTYNVICCTVFIITGILYDQLVHPRIVGRSVGLHPVVSFFVILSGGALFGLAGMLLAFPVAGMVKVILDRLIRYTTTTSAEDIDLPRIPSRHAAS